MQIGNTARIVQVAQLTQWRDRAGFSPNFQVLREPLHCIVAELSCQSFRLLVAVNPAIVRMPTRLRHPGKLGQPGHARHHVLGQTLLGSGDGGRAGQFR